MRRPVAAAIAIALGGCSAPTDEQAIAGSRMAITSGWDDDGDHAVVGLMRGGALTCSGTLFGPSVVVTAAHCVDVFVPEVAVFGFDPGRPSDRVEVLRVHAHPAYERATLEHDIAVVELAYDVDVSPAYLPTRPITEEWIGAQARIVGFGAPGAGAAGPLRKREGFSRIAALDHTRFELGGDPSQPCLGDSGGPTFLRLDGAEPIVGVHSGGRASCTGGSRETRVDAHLEFLEAHASIGYRTEAPGEALSGCAVTGRRPRGDALPWAACALWLLTRRRAPSRAQRSANASGVSLDRGDDGCDD